MPETGKPRGQLTPVPLPSLPRAQSGHGYEDQGQGICTMRFPCRERDRDSLAPGNQANGHESGVIGCSEGQGSLGTWGMWAEAG